MAHWRQEKPTNWVTHKLRVGLLRPLTDKIVSVNGFSVNGNPVTLDGNRYQNSQSIWLLDGPDPKMMVIIIKIITR